MSYYYLSDITDHIKEQCYEIQEELNKDNPDLKEVMSYVDSIQGCL